MADPSGASAPAIPDFPIDPQRIKLAQSLADKAAKQLSHAVFEAMSSCSGNRRNRWLCSLAHYPWLADPHQVNIETLAPEELTAPVDPAASAQPQPA